MSLPPQSNDNKRSLPIDINELQANPSFKRPTTLVNLLNNITCQLETAADNHLKSVKNKISEYQQIQKNLIDQREDIDRQLKELANQKKLLEEKLETTKSDIEKNKNELNKQQLEIEKTLLRHAYSKFCSKLVFSDPEKSGLWQFTGTECPVCSNKYKVTVKLSNCEHLMCLSCLKTMYERNALTCPVCRHRFAGYEIFDRNTLKTTYVSNSDHYKSYNNSPSAAVRINNNL